MIIISQSVLVILSCLVFSLMMGGAETAPAPAPAPSVVVANPLLTALVLAKLAALKGYIYTNILNNGEAKQVKRH